MRATGRIIGFSIFCLALGACQSELPANEQQPGRGDTRPASSPTARGTPGTIIPTNAEDAAASANSVSSEWCSPSPELAAPDPVRLVYLGSDGAEAGIWLWDQGQEPRHLAAFDEVLDLSLKPEGELVAFLKGDLLAGVELWTISVESGISERVLSIEEMQALSGGNGIVWPMLNEVVWVPGKSVMVFQPAVNRSGEIERLRQVWKLSIEERSLNFMGVGDFQLSPDGTMLLIWSESGIEINGVDGQPLRTDLFPSFRLIVEKDRQFFLEPQWSERSEAIFVIQPGEDRVYDSNARFKLWKVYVEEIPPRLIGEYQGFARSVSFSPMGRFMIYLDTWNQARQLHLVNLETGEDSVYVDRELIQFSSEWSPAGDRFIYHQGYEMYLGSVCGSPSDTTEMPFLNFNTFVEWVDSERVLVRQLDEGQVWIENISSLERDSRPELHIPGRYEFVVVPVE